MSQKVYSQRKCSVNPGSRPGPTALSLPGGLLPTTTTIPSAPPTSPSNALNLGCSPSPHPSPRAWRGWQLVLRCPLQLRPGTDSCSWSRFPVPSALWRGSRFPFCGPQFPRLQTGQPSLPGPLHHLITGAANRNSASTLRSPGRTVYQAEEPVHTGLSGQEPARPLLTTKRLPLAKSAPGRKVCPHG